MPDRGSHPVEQRGQRSDTATRRGFIGGVIATGTVASVSGCLTGLTGSGGGGGSSNDSGTSGGSKGALNIAAVEGSGRLFKRLVNNYVVDDTGVDVNITLVPFSNLHAKINSVLGNKGNSYDIIFLPDIWLPQYAADLEPIKQWLPGSYPSNQVIDSCIDDQTWPAPDWPAVPSSEGLDEKMRAQTVVGNTQMFAYNKKHYEKVGADAPETWSDVLSAGKKIEKQIDGVDGFIIRGKSGNPVMTNVFPALTSKAGPMFDDNWKFNWDGNAGVDALSYYVNDLKSISPDGVASFDSDKVLNRLSNGTVAQASVWPAAASLLLNSNESNVADNIKFTVCPKGAKQRAPLIGTWMAGINKYTSDARKKKAGKVIASFISPKAQEKYVELGGVPFRNDTLKQNTDAQPWFKALRNSLQQAVFRPRTPLWNQMGITFGQYVNSALAGQMSPEKVMNKAQTEFHDLMDKSGYYD